MFEFPKPHCIERFIGLCLGCSYTQARVVLVGWEACRHGREAGMNTRDDKIAWEKVTSQPQTSWKPGVIQPASLAFDAINRHGEVEAVLRNLTSGVSPANDKPRQKTLSSSVFCKTLGRFQPPQTHAFIAPAVNGADNNQGALNKPTNGVTGIMS
jgi:hypothetical protein